MEKGRFLRKRMPFRAWYYFRAGYSQYFAFILALINMYTLTYYLAIADNPALHSIFPNFYLYAVVFSVVGFPLLVIVGYIHMKKSQAFSSEMDITAEAFPYNYRLAPGIQSECIAPLYLELLRLGRKALSNETITEEELKKINELNQKLDLLATGGSLPIKRDNKLEVDQILGMATSRVMPDNKKSEDQKVQNTKLD